ncbi:hypothetical protein DNTS_017271 [Danionella cerebrum]|uniref:Uncharacterized protein n=1 Tax=Danionella cerebrum TaxID=2873325 RepID=A0A553PJ53_9TELE|nr:hypothetical protein DNTS_017271 [Danionella translucida]
MEEVISAGHERWISHSEDGHRQMSVIISMEMLHTLERKSDEGGKSEDQMLALTPVFSSLQPSACPPGPALTVVWPLSTALS